jgi:hypothetical protein
LSALLLLGAFQRLQVNWLSQEQGRELHVSHAGEFGGQLDAVLGADP